MVQQYEDPIKAIVHRTLEVYIEEAFEEFIGDTIRKAMLRAGDNKIVKEYRNGYRYLKHGIVGTLALTHILVPRNRAGGFKLAILTRMQQQIDTIALLISSLYINGISVRKILVQF
ncbi:MAG: transposase [Spirochaetes bacterium]|nr:transposase [Spirochaetota bacterium]